MHAGSIANQKTAAARVYNLIRSNPTRRFSTREVQDLAFVCAPSTHVSEVNKQLRDGEEIVCEQVGRLFYYQYRPPLGPLFDGATCRP